MQKDAIINGNWGIILNIRQRVQLAAAGFRRLVLEDFAEPEWVMSAMSSSGRNEVLALIASYFAGL
jgi:hypothetical protein